MKCLHIITPVKDSIDFTLETVQAIVNSELKVPFTYTVYNLSLIHISEPTRP